MLDLRIPPPTPLAVLTAVLLISVTAVANDYLRDAGQEGDAGNTADAARLVGYGAHRGWIFPNWATDPADWYRVADDTTRPACLEFEASGRERTRVVFTALWDGGDHTLGGQFGNYSGVRAVVAVPGTTGSLMGFHAPDDKPSAAPLLNDYHFSLTRTRLRDLGPGDGGSGRDANGLQGPVPVPGDCFGGTLHPGAIPSLGDRLDTYTYEGKASTTLLLSFAQVPGTPPLTFTLVSPEGMELLSLGSGEMAEVTLPTDGTYTMSTSTGVAGGVVEYVTGLFKYEGPPGSGSPCRPSCMGSTR